jgi:ATP-dependent DNA ligase
MPAAPRVGIYDAELGQLWHRLQRLAISEMPLDIPPPRTSPFGSPLVLNRVHWVRPELVAEVKYLTWTDENLETSNNCVFGPRGRGHSGLV